MSETETQDPINDKAMPLLDHLIELRRRLLWSGAAFLIAFLICYYYSAWIYGFLARPLAQALQGQPHTQLIFTQLYEAFFTYLKVAMFGALFISFPVLATQLWMFVAPGLYRSEKRAMLPFLVATPILFIMGAALAYFFVFPYAWRFFLSFQSPKGGGGLPIVAMPRVSEYLALVMKLILAFGVAFELPVGLSLLAKVGILTSKQLKAYRRYAYVGMFVIAAVLAPPDVFTQTGLAVPLILLYESSIIAARMVEPKRDEADESED